MKWRCITAGLGAIHRHDSPDVAVLASRAATGGLAQISDARTKAVPRIRYAPQAGNEIPFSQDNWLLLDPAPSVDGPKPSNVILSPGGTDTGAASRQAEERDLTGDYRSNVNPGNRYFHGASEDLPGEGGSNALRPPTVASGLRFMSLFPARSCFAHGPC